MAEFSRGVGQHQCSPWVARIARGSVPATSPTLGVPFRPGNGIWVILRIVSRQQAMHDLSIE